MFMPGLLMTTAEDEAKIIGIIDETRVLMPQVEARLQEDYLLKNKTPKYQVLNLRMADLETAKQQAAALLDSAIIQAFLVIPADVWDSNRVYYYAKNIANYRDQGELDRTITRVVRSVKLKETGFPEQLVDQILKPIDFQVRKFTAGGEEQAASEMVAMLMPMLYVLMLFFAIFTSAQILMRSVLAERTNRLVEILLSSVTPRQLMSGKIIGLGLLGLTQLAIYLAMAIIASEYKGLELVNPTNVTLFLIYFILGYLVYAAIFGTLGSLFDNEQDAQSAVSIFSLICILPIMLSSYVISNPQSLVTVILSYIPIMTPFFMILRMGIFMPAWWEIISTIAILLLSVWFLMVAAGKVFRTAILIYGKRPTLPEIWQWIRRN
jgi:ABC-2 type transport system permease protein